MYLFADAGEVKDSIHEVCCVHCYSDKFTVTAKDVVNLRFLVVVVIAVVPKTSEA